MPGFLFVLSSAGKGRRDTEVVTAQTEGVHAMTKAQAAAFFSAVLTLAIVFRICEAIW